MPTTSLASIGKPISKIYLETMISGEQNTKQQAMAHIDFVLAHEVNFWNITEIDAIHMQQPNPSL